MARVTVEDCLDKVENRFELILLASHRARKLSQGAQITIPRDNDKNTVLALREIAERTLSPGDLKEELIHSMQKFVEIDEPEPQPAGNADEVAEVFGNESDRQPEEQQFDSMSEEELIAGIAKIVTPDRNDDF